VGELRTPRDRRPEWVKRIAHSVQSTRSHSSFKQWGGIRTELRISVEYYTPGKREGWQITVDAPELAGVLYLFGLCDDSGLNNADRELPNLRN
jgi:hypothetical protein